jgi:glyoxylase-like metal-dependent hydrolase (beta-lactamase superfamily II)
MAGWMQLAMQRDLPPPSSLDHLVQFDRVGKGALGYLLVSDGAAFIIDPPRDPSAYLAAAAEASAKVVGVADTHCHADYLSGGPALAAALEVPYYLHPADSSYPYDGTPGRLSIRELTDGSEIALGRASVRASHTPGHTEGSVTFLVDDEAAFTGDFIFVASIGRPDLAGKTAEWTEQLWASLATRIARWGHAWATCCSATSPWE